MSHSLNTSVAWQPNMYLLLIRSDIYIIIIIIIIVQLKMHLLFTRWLGLILIALVSERSWVNIALVSKISWVQTGSYLFGLLAPVLLIFMWGSFPLGSLVVSYTINACMIMTRLQCPGRCLWLPTVLNHLLNPLYLIKLELSWPRPICTRCQLPTHKLVMHCSALWACSSSV